MSKAVTFASCPDRDDGGWHCYHTVDVQRDSFRTETTSRCCHCGNVKVEVREHSGRGFPSRGYDPDEHGPHQPRPSTPTWGSR